MLSLRLPSASSLERALACTASEVLPHVHVSSDDATRGTEIHAFVRRIANRTPFADALAHVSTAHRETCRSIDLNRVIGGLSQVRGEVAYAIDVDAGTVAELGINLGRKYPPTSGSQFVGTNDLEGMRMDGVPCVSDVKTGYLDVTPAIDNPQAKFHALAQSRRTGLPEVEARIIKIGEGGRVDLDCAEFDLFALESFEDELRDLRADIHRTREHYLRTGEPPTVHAGDWCRYCPAMAACPKHVALAKTMVQDVTTIAAQLSAMTPEQQGVAVEKARAIKTILDNVLDGLKDLARQNAIPMPNGKLYAETRSHNTSFDKPKALELLRAKGVDGMTIASLYRTIETHPVKIINDPAVAPKRRRSKAT